MPSPQKDAADAQGRGAAAEIEAGSFAVAGYHRTPPTASAGEALAEAARLLADAQRLGVAAMIKVEETGLAGPRHRLEALRRLYADAADAVELLGELADDAAGEVRAARALAPLRLAAGKAA